MIRKIKVIQYLILKHNLCIFTNFYKDIIVILINRYFINKGFHFLVDKIN